MENFPDNDNHRTISDKRTKRDPLLAAPDYFNVKINIRQNGTFPSSFIYFCFNLLYKHFRNALKKNGIETYRRQNNFSHNANHLMTHVNAKTAIRNDEFSRIIYELIGLRILVVPLERETSVFVSFCGIVWSGRVPICPFCEFRNMQIAHEGGNMSNRSILWMKKRFIYRFSNDRWVHYVF